jgi:predicted RNA-binding Zn ribbon-like protein
MADWVRKNVLIEKIAEADAENDRSKATVQAKNAVRKAFEKRLRQVVAEYLYKVQ